MCFYVHLYAYKYVRTYVCIMCICLSLNDIIFIKRSLKTKNLAHWTTSFIKGIIRFDNIKMHADLKLCRQCLITVIIISTSISNYEASKSFRIY